MYDTFWQFKFLIDSKFIDFLLQVYFHVITTKKNLSHLDRVRCMEQNVEFNNQLLSIKNISMQEISRSNVTGAVISLSHGLYYIYI